MKKAPRMQDDAPAQQNSGPRVRRSQSSKPALITCPKCNEAAAVLAAKCQDSDKWYPKVNPDGSPGKCPD